MTELYSKKVMEHFLHPKHMGKIEKADGIGSTENLRCGYSMNIYIKVGQKDNQEIIKDIKFETMGCGHAISASDMICDLAKGRTLGEAKKIKFSDVIKELGEIPQPKIHCSSLAEHALKQAIKDYETKKGK